MTKKEDLATELINEINDTPKGYNIHKLVTAYLSKWEIEIRVDQCRQDEKTAIDVIKSMN